MSERKVYGFLHDEQGNRSMSRLLLSCTLVFTGLVILADTFLEVTVPPEAYALLGSLLVGLVAWAGGSSIARYIGPQLGGIAQGIAAASTARGTAASATMTLTPGAAAPPAAAPPAAPPSEAENVSHEWADGHPDEGII